MEKETRLVQADQQVVLDVGGNHFRIVSDPVTVAFLRRTLSEHVIEGDALTGYKLTMPDSTGSDDGPEASGHPSGLAVLVDCTGAVLARSRDRQAVLAALAGHLAALSLGPPHQDACRFRLRTLVAADHAVFAAEPFFSRPPIVERRLARLGYRLADTPFVDVNVGSLALQPFEVPWPALSAFEPDPAHARPDTLTQNVTRLFWPSYGEPTGPSPAQVRHALASVALSGTREQRLANAERVAERIEIVRVPAGDEALLYDALRRLDGD